MIVTITPNPCVDKTLFVSKITPGQKIKAVRYACIAGGKGCNVSRAVKAMGGETLAMPVVGGPTGRHVVDMIEKGDGVRCLPIWVEQMTRTITTVLEEPEHRQTAFFEPGPAVSAEEYDRIIETVDDVLQQTTVLVMSGSASDDRLDMLYYELTRLARRKGAKTIVDSYGVIMQKALEARPKMIKPNLEELELLMDRRLDSRRQQWDAVHQLRDRGIEQVVLSLGAEGALVAASDIQLEVKPPSIKEINAVGSGDALVAGFALGMSKNMSIEETARWAVAMGAANAMSWDIGSFTRDQVEVLLPQVECYMHWPQPKNR
jgi:1-phosphofructokinase family hexose kinase